MHSQPPPEPSKELGHAVTLTKPLRLTLDFQTPELEEKNCVLFEATKSVY